MSTHPLLRVGPEYCNSHALLSHGPCRRPKKCHSNRVGGGGCRMRLMWSPDWAALTRTLNCAGPTCQQCCAECYANKNEFRNPGHASAQLRSLDSYDTHCSDFVALFMSKGDIVYDVLPSAALVLAHGILHVVRFWVSEHCVDRLPSLDRISEDHLSMHPYFAPLTRNIQRSDWITSNLHMTEFLDDGAILLKLKNVLPRNKDGPKSRTPLPDDGAVLADPLQEYLSL